MGIWRERGCGSRCGSVLACSIDIFPTMPREGTMCRIFYVSIAGHFSALPHLIDRMKRKKIPSFYRNPVS